MISAGPGAKRNGPEKLFGVCAFFGLASTAGQRGPSQYLAALRVAVVASVRPRAASFFVRGCWLPRCARPPWRRPCWTWWPSSAYRPGALLMWRSVRLAASLLACAAAEGFRWIYRRLSIWSCALPPSWREMAAGRYPLDGLLSPVVLRLSFGLPPFVGPALSGRQSVAHRSSPSFSRLSLRISASRSRARPWALYVLFW